MNHKMLTYVCKKFNSITGYSSLQCSMPRYRYTKKSNIPNNINFKSDATLRALGRGSVEEKVRNEAKSVYFKVQSV